jgi:hypothetical protein
MKAVEQRIKRLEDRLVPPDEPIVAVIMRAGQGSVTDLGACVQILKDAGFTGRTGVFFANLGRIPEGSSATELREYLLENGDSIVPRSRP